MRLIRYKGRRTIIYSDPFIMYKNLIKIALIAALVMPAASALALDVIGPDKPKPKKNVPVMAGKKVRPNKKKNNKGKAHGFCKKIDNFLANVWKEEGIDGQKTDVENSKAADKALANAKTEEQKNAIAAAAQEMHKAVNTALEQKRNVIVEAAKKAQADCKAKPANERGNEKIKAEFMASRKKAQATFKLALEAAKKQFHTKVSEILSKK